MPDNTENPVKIEKKEVGERVHETRVRLDQPVNADHPLAVIVPEGVGASGVEDEPLLGVYDDGSPEEQFAAGRADSVVTSSKPESDRTVEAREARQSRSRKAVRAVKGEDDKSDD